jgi:hypothetical protein
MMMNFVVVIESHLIFIEQKFCFSSTLFLLYLKSWSAAASDFWFPSQI